MRLPSAASQTVHTATVCGAFDALVESAANFTSSMSPSSSHRLANGDVLRMEAIEWQRPVASAQLNIDGGFDATRGMRAREQRTRKWTSGADTG